MAEPDNSKTFVRETRTTQPSGSGMALIIGGVVVAVGFILWLVLGGNVPLSTTEPASTTTNVTIEPPAAPADTTTSTTVDPAPDAAEPKPVAPADGAEPVVPATPPANP